MKAISLHSVVPVRTNPQETAEQQTQMLFGETCTIVEQKPRWNRIKLDIDGQEGWVDSKMITIMGKDEYVAHTFACKKAAFVAYPMTYAVSVNNGQTIPLTAGTRLPNYKDGQFNILGVSFRVDASMVVTAPMELNSQNLLQIVRFFLNVPYLWGGKNALGMDCSGFTQIVMSLFGKKLLRNAGEQVTQGRKINQLKNAKVGDLVFFDYYTPEQRAERVTHVGVVLDSERVIHCSGRVKVEKLDEIGIFSIEQASPKCPKGQYTHRLMAIKRV